MLVLTRKLQQQIKIGEQITVTILKVKGNTVRVGIQAPREVRVIRAELPKEGAAPEDAAAESIVTSSVTLSVGEGSPAAGSSIDETAGAAVDAADERILAGETQAPLSAAHLPLRRIRHRQGAAPLKRVITSCATLAK